MDIEDRIRGVLEQRFAAVRREIEAWLLERHTDPETSELLTFEVDAQTKLLVLVPVELAEDVQACPLAELRARYPTKEIRLP